MEPRSTMLAALAQPKEREKLLRLEQELTRLVNNPSQDRLDMQPMSLHQRLAAERCVMRPSDSCEGHRVV